MRRIFLIFTGLLMAAMAIARTYVVAVGVSAYSDEQYSLRKPAGDATKFTQIMRKHNCDAVLITNRYATTNNILAKLDSVLGLITEEDNIFFFYSGHGWKGSLITYDGIQTGENLQYSVLRDRLNGSKAKAKFCFVDACYSGSVAEEYKKGQTTADPSEADGIFYFMSSSPGETSLENSKYDNGLFTQALAAGLSGFADGNQDRALTVHELFKYIYMRVTKMSSKKDVATGQMVERQHPQLIGPRNLIDKTYIIVWEKPATQPATRPQNAVGPKKPSTVESSAPQNGGDDDKNDKKSKKNKKKKQKKNKDKD